MVGCQAAWFMQRHKHSDQERFMLLLQGQCKPIDDASQDFQQLSNTIETFRLVDELEKYIVDGFSNVGSQVQEFSIESV